ncbi:unnamed protein product [marine sediment metagenome]|uniref:Glutamine amidotransferase domain-containing protein n=1 Tax=marine sediment metagenome TaxID=412755 RepID=X1BER4_9ZZZZ
MKVGHHGLNYPVRSPDSYKGDITVQNHSYVFDEKSLSPSSILSLEGRRMVGVKITLRNVNDNSIEEIESLPLKFISAQYYPVSPGSGEVNEVFRRFLKMV